MNIRSPLKKFFTVIVWCLLGGSGLALLIAAINSKNASLCGGLDIEINEGNKTVFLNKRDVAAMLEAQGLKDIRNRKAASVDLLKIETALRRNSWIRDVQLYFDNNQMLKVRIQERQPVARLFTASGNSFLIDSAGIQLALTERNVFRLPLFTGYPAERFGVRKDSALDAGIRNIALFLNKDGFWASQIQEVHITPGKSFVMTPLIGAQEIEFGDGNDYADKFRRLLVFYKEVITRTGFEKYNSFNVSFANQVIAKRRDGAFSRIDSIQARKTVMEMIRQAQKIEMDTVKIRESRPLEKNTITEQSLQGYDLPEEKEAVPANHKQHKKQ